MIHLVPPDARYRSSYLAATDEFGDAHRDGDGLWSEPPDGPFPGYELTRAELETPDEFARLVGHRLGAAREEAPRRPGFVPCTFLWMVDGAEYVGSLAIRHRLTDHLLTTGGHIGYSVRPSARRRGVATEALRQALPHAAALGIDPALLTCDADNEASRRTILANGGVYEDTRDGSTQRYWVPTTGSRGPSA